MSKARKLMVVWHLFICVCLFALLIQMTITGVNILTSPYVFWNDKFIAGFALVIVGMNVVIAYREELEEIWRWWREDG